MFQEYEEGTDKDNGLDIDELYVTCKVKTPFVLVFKESVS